MKIMNFAKIILIFGIVSCSDAFNDDAIHQPFLNNNDINCILSGLPDVNFGIGGITLTDFNGGDDQGHDIAIQEDGKVIAVGSSINNKNKYYRIAIARYNLDGSIDTSFGNRGKIIEDFNNLYGSRAFSVAVQNDGKIVVVGRIETYTEFANNVLLPYSSNMIVLRYNPDGTRDTTFGNNGIVINNTFNLQKPFELANKVAIQPDGKIIVAGCSQNKENDGKLRFVVLRYCSNGLLDSSFGTGGYVIVNPPSSGEETIAHDIALKIDNDTKSVKKIVIAGGVYYSSIVPNPSRSLAICLTENGSFDDSFGNSGVKIDSNILEAKCVAIQSDNKILLSGTPNEYNRFTVIRYNENGTSDSTFGTNGKAEFTFESTIFICRTTKIYALTDGNIFMVGYYASGLALLKLTSKGDLDLSFGSYGSTFSNLNHHSTQISRSVISVINNNTLITIIGYQRVGEYRDFILARFWL
ncbi:MAG: delta-60 repeat domain-containing protein [Spirochaetes bacterium]|nr:delta-60 repeat domain-containing protein [Spirochaetota bacterium]